MSSSPIFSKVQAAYAHTSLFNLGFENKLTTNWFKITPFLCKEILPGDIARVKTEQLVRLAPMFYPLMQRIRVYTHFFFVPYRLLWDKWESFITQSEQGTYTVPGNPSNKTDFPTELPTITLPEGAILPSSNGIALQVWNEVIKSGSLADYLGLNFSPAGLNHAVGSQIAGEDVTFQYLPFLAYQKIYNDFYRDENLEEDDFIMATDGNHEYEAGTSGPNSLLDEVLFKFRYRYWPKDYFTSALPWTQKGDDMTLPLQGRAPVFNSIGDPSEMHVGLSGNLHVPGTSVQFYRPNTDYEAGEPIIAKVIANNTVQLGVEPSAAPLLVGNNAQDVSLSSVDAYGSLNSIYTDLSQATPTTINELRRAVALQRWSEINARGGTRYVEQLQAHFGVRPRDSRLQRAEYLGGGVSDITISEVLQTSGSDINGETTPQGNMAGHGVNASYNHAFKRYFSEHGVLIGLMTILPNANYYQGAQRQYLKRGVYDFGWPSLAHLGEQPIYDAEIFNDGIPRNVEAEENVFGYTPRYAEYKFSNDEIHGDFRTSLSNWHTGRVFGNTPNLNKTFANGQNFSPNVFSVQDVDPFWCDMYIDIKMSRKLPKFGTPSIL
ncbi:major capsid protein [Microvirus mar23]|uniref:Major capsid protein n=1 Tax=Microvirus mar23 TaxID=2851156 RepID=A0A8F5MIU7_9VIRU|nr:major capsid protein [Microvirus mar23]